MHMQDYLAKPQNIQQNPLLTLKNAKFPFHLIH